VFEGADKNRNWWKKGRSPQLLHSRRATSIFNNLSFDKAMEILLIFYFVLEKKDKKNSGSILVGRPTVDVVLIESSLWQDLGLICWAFPRSLTSNWNIIILTRNNCHV
jgi:hypothetical protein